MIIINFRLSVLINRNMVYNRTWLYCKEILDTYYCHTQRGKKNP